MTPDLHPNISDFPFDQAHARYATSVAAFITVQSEDLFTDEEVAVFFVYSPHPLDIVAQYCTYCNVPPLFKVTMAETTMETLRDYTSDFLVPFAAASAMENDGSDSSPWMIR